MGGKTDRPAVARVILGSVPPELESEREAVARALTRLRDSAPRGLECFSFDADDATCAEPGDPAQCQVYIGLLAAQGPTIHFEPEYRLAIQHGLHCLIYIKDNPTAAPKKRRGKTKQPPVRSGFAAELIRGGTALTISDPDDLEAKITADLSRWLSDHERPPSQDHAARPDATRATAPALITSPNGNQGVGVARDVVGSTIITGNHNVIYRDIVQHYPSLKDFAYDFGDLIEKATSRFVGRDAFFRRLDDFAKRPCGYFRVVADAGLGKTALAAEAAKKLNASAFFAGASRGLTRPDQCLNHLAVELIARFGLAHDHLPARAGEDSAYLSKVLTDAAVKSNGPLWIVVDGLDEADRPGPGRNPLLLPDRLPHHVYFLLTHRPGDFWIATDAGTANEEVRIASSDASQQTDIVTYLRQEVDRPEIRRAREAANPPITADQLVSVLQSKSEGNFKYLEYVLAEIAARPTGSGPLDPEALPNGLRSDYHQFWAQIEQVRGQEGWPEWKGLYRRAIEFLAAAREPVPASWLAQLIGRPADDAWRSWVARRRRWMWHAGLVML